MKMNDIEIVIKKLFIDNPDKESEVIPVFGVTIKDLVISNEDVFFVKEKIKNLPEEQQDNIDDHYMTIEISLNRVDIIEILNKLVNGNLKLHIPIDHIINEVMFNMVEFSTIEDSDMIPYEKSGLTTDINFHRKRIKEFKLYDLKRWGGFVTKHPNDKSINFALECLVVLEELSLPPIFVNPLPDGGVIIEGNGKSGKYYTVEIYNKIKDNEYNVVLLTGNNNTETTKINEISNIRELKEFIKRDLI